MVFPCLFLPHIPPNFARGESQFATGAASRPALVKIARDVAEYIEFVGVFPPMNSFWGVSFCDALGGGTGPHRYSYRNASTGSKRAACQEGKRVARKERAMAAAVTRAKSLHRISTGRVVK